MKIQCDVCNKSEAAVYCSADEAALCSACDHRVHHANKLAGKHPRFSLLHPSPSDSPLCDICQDKKALLFCQQDRAILCKDCDAAIHRVNQHTQNHHRFLLTGVKLSPTASVYSSSTPPATAPTPLNNQTSIKQLTTCHQEPNGSGHGSTTSSISKYLIETLPGWHVEDFLDSPASFTKALDNDPGPIWGGDLVDGRLNGSFSPESMGLWVPQAPATYAAHVVQQLEPGLNMGFGDQMINGSSLVFAQNDYSKITNDGGGKSSRKWVSDTGNCFTVPQISPASKRSTTPWR